MTTQRTKRQASARRRIARYKDRTTSKVLVDIAVGHELLDRTIDAVDDQEIEAIKAEIGARGLRHPPSE